MSPWKAPAFTELPPYEVLEAAPEGLTLLVVNARHMKNVPGISATASLSIIAEIGVDMDSFKTASWASLSPGSNESAGRRNSYLSAWYWKLKQKKGTKLPTIYANWKSAVFMWSFLRNRMAP